MSLKLDELRKRLLQQQSGSDCGAAEAPAGAGSGRALGAPPLKIVEAAAAAFKASEPHLVIKTPESAVGANATEPPVEGKPASEAAPATATSERPAVGAGDAAEKLASSENEPASEVARPRSGRTAAASTDAVFPDPASQHELADAVGKVFEQTEAFQSRLEELNRIFEPIDRMGTAAVRAFAPLRGFQKQMVQLARSFEPMRAFQQQLSQLAQNFEPMKALEGQLSQLAESFQSHIGDLIKALEPAKQMRERIEQLGAAFDEAAELQEQFAELYDSFQLSPAANGHGNGLDAQGEAG
jgi:hypothetical protein